MDGVGDQVAIVTGGAGAIGGAVADALAELGALVATLDAASAAPRPGCVALQVDVSDPGAMQDAVAEVTRRLGRPELLVCAAGVASEHAFVDLAPAEWQRVVDASLTGTYLACRAVIGPMVEAGAGRIVAFSSGFAAKGAARAAHYAAAKAGVEALVKSVALEVAAAGVRVNAVAPGPVETPFLDYIGDAGHLDEWRRLREAQIPMGRLAAPADLVGPTLFLLGAQSAYITGQVLHVNGGMLMP